MSLLLSFPILTRAYRTQWRDRRFFVFLWVLVVSLGGFLLWRYADESVSYSSTRDVAERLRAVGQSLWWQVAWLQTVVALLVAPALTAGSIARERERGLLESLQMAPLAPLRIVLEKWLSALAPLLLMLGVLMPFNLIAILLGGLGFRQLVALLAFQMLLAASGAAIGLACSAWARRAHLALRSAYGLIVVWLLASGAAAALAGDTILGPQVGFTPPFYMAWVGRTNPLFGASDLIVAQTPGDRWAQSVATLIFISLLCVWTSVRALRKPLDDAPFIQSKRRAKSETKTAQSGHFEVPLVGALRFDNPVMGREVRSKFRLRQPPLGVIAVEIVLAVMVAYFYVRTLFSAFTDPSVRVIIFFGVAFTGVIVTLMSCGIMGANGFSREHEGGTWESLRLSLLRPRAIVGGKFWGIALTCALFSLPVWPLLLPCIEWNDGFWGTPYGNTVAVSQLVTVVLVWASSGCAATLWGLWLGLRTRKSSSASGATLGSGVAWLAGGPLVLLSFNSRDAEVWVSMLNPFAALVALGGWSSGWLIQTGAAFAIVSTVFSIIIWQSLKRKLRADLGR